MTPSPSDHGADKDRSETVLTPEEARRILALLGDVPISALAAAARELSERTKREDEDQT